MSDYGAIQTDQEIKDLEKHIEEVYADAKKDIEKKLNSFMEKHRVKQEIHLQELKKGEISKADYDAWMQGQIFQRDQWKAKRDQIVRTISRSNTISTNMINGKMSDVFAINANYASYDMEHKAGVNFGFGIYNSASVTDLIKNNPQILPKWKIDEKKDYIWNEKQVNKAVTQGIIQGEKLDQITKRLTDGLVANNENLMKTFARTAMTEAQNAGRWHQMKESEKLGIELEKEWMATLDSHTRDSHANLDGERQPVDHEFSNGLMYPADPGGEPAEVYNCRCTMVSDVKKYPDRYQRRDNINGEPIRNMPYRKWEQIRKNEKATGIKTKLPMPKQFKADFDKAKATVDERAAWRVDDTYTVNDYEHKTLFELEGGSTVAVTPEGDIVSVCKNQNAGKEESGKKLLQVAVANGGDRLDAFADLYGFYTKNGFEPVSWTPFDERYAPHDWQSVRDNPEPVIFYRYTGKNTDMSLIEFLMSTPACEGENGYDDAKAIRNKAIDDAK